MSTPCVALFTAGNSNFYSLAFRRLSFSPPRRPFSLKMRLACSTRISRQCTRVKVAARLYAPPARLKAGGLGIVPSASHNRWLPRVANRPSLLLRLSPSQVPIASNIRTCPQRSNAKPVARLCVPLVTSLCRVAFMSAPRARPLRKPPSVRAAKSF